MATLEDREIEGVTAFAPPPAPTYRYVIALKNEKLSIRLEDRTTKKQWYKGDLDRSDYVSSDTTILNASAADYALCFQESLDCALDDSGDVQRTLTVFKGDHFRLELTMKIRVLRSVWSAQYTFDLEPVSVERIDILESKLCDQQEELERLRHDQEIGQILESKVRDQQEELERLRRDQEAGRTPIFLEAEASRMSQDGKLLCWNKVESDNFDMNGLDGVIRFRLPGVYSISVVVNYAPVNYNLTVELLKGSTGIRSAYCCYAGGNYSSNSLGCTTRFEKDEKLSVSCGANLVGHSYLSVVWLGQ
ncbi:hypothetical protein BBJ28_00024989 [Nothophytophthora sp. Chile5]|nr:hypothetical protein BBJ28_00024989 [Nothophytophthora sp. Chile5]